VGIGDFAVSPVALDRLGAAIPSLCLVGIGGPLPQLDGDVCGRSKAEGKALLRGPLRDQSLGDGVLSSRRVSRRRHPFKPLDVFGKPLAKQLFAFAGVGKLLAALAPAKPFDRFTVGDGLLVLSLAFLDRTQLASVDQDVGVELGIAVSRGAVAEVAAR